MSDQHPTGRPKHDLRVTVLQQALVWQDGNANRKAFGELILKLAGKTDLIALPEMFTAGFSMDTEKVAEQPQGVTLDWMRAMAAESGAVIVGSYGVLSEQGVVNRLIWMRPDGTHVHYDKRHLFRMAGEHKRYAAGAERVIVDLKGWRCCPMTCYDLRFPVWCRNRNDYDLLIFVANWPAARAYHWRSLLVARAIENLSCLVAVNRVGEDGNGHAYSGDSMILDAKGEALVDPMSERGLFTAVLKAADLNTYRERFPAHLDADDFTILD
jgi:predicted amidohydrolase